MALNLCAITFCRPSFKSLQRITFEVPVVPIMALTATAPPDTLQMLKESLNDPFVFKSSSDRPNISLHARRNKYGGQLPPSVMNGKTSAG